MKAFSAMLLAFVFASPSFAQPIKAGYAKEDITPAGPVQMGGYNLRGAPSEGVYEGDRLFVRAICFTTAPPPFFSSRAI